MTSGFILIHKPSGPTSHDIINALRRITGIKKIGHAGTLDPFASGLLICAISREATREIDKFIKLDKEYIADIFLGAESDTYDRTGKIIKTRHHNALPKIPPLLIRRGGRGMRSIIEKFIGPNKQTPPMYSAKKINGKKLYELARKGIEVERKPQEVNIYAIKIIDYEWPILKIKVHCSSGTYIRSLAHDIGQALGDGAYLQELQRTAIGNFKLSQAVDLGKLTSDNWKKYLTQSLSV